MNNYTMSNVLSHWLENYTITRNFEYKDGVHIVLWHKHWIALYIKDNVVDFFDSFGRPPIHFMLRFKGKHVIVHSKRLQHDESNVCGYYCLAFIYMKLKGNLSQFFQMFSEDKRLNDFKVVQFVHMLLT